MTEPEADFEIDFYGDEADDEPQQAQQENHNAEAHDEAHDHQNVHQDNDSRNRNGDGNHEDYDEHDVRQGTKRKQEEGDHDHNDDDRPVDANATSAVMFSELNWWITDDDIRGWLKKADCEMEVKDLTFSEHKINGKSKGLVVAEHKKSKVGTHKWTGRHMLNFTHDRPQRRRSSSGTISQQTAASRRRSASRHRTGTRG